MSDDLIDKDMVSAATNGMTDTVQLLIEERADVNYHHPDWYNVTALICSAFHGHAGVAKLLLEHKADVNAKNSSNRTALIYSADKGHAGVAKLLLEHKADVNAIDKCFGKTAADYAQHRNHAEVLAILTPLVKTTHTVRYSGGHKVIFSGHPYRDHRDHRDHRDRQGSSRYTQKEKTALKMNKDLVLEALNGAIDTVQLLLQKRADVNYHHPDWGNANALICSVDKGHDGLAKLLLEHKADVDAKNSSNLTPLMCSILSCHTGLAKLLLEHKADVNAKDKDNDTALICAANRGHAGLTKLLLEYKADVNAKDKDNSTALLHSAHWGYAGVAKLLLEHKADVNAKDKYVGKSAVEYARAMNHAEVLAMLEAEPARREQVQATLTA